MIVYFACLALQILYVTHPYVALTRLSLLPTTLYGPDIYSSNDWGSKQLTTQYLVVGISYLINLNIGHEVFNVQIKSMVHIYNFPLCLIYKVHENIY